MPNFPPLRHYVFSLVDRWIRRYGLGSPALEFGCGTGELAIHLARRGWAGIVFDTSPDALARARRALAAYPRFTIAAEGLAAVPAGAARTVFLMDVLEHVPDDVGLLRTLAEKTAPGGHLIALTSVNPAEWGYDDEFYGHLRRYDWGELAEKLADAGFSLLEDRDVTFPIFWALRRLYLRILPRHPQSLSAGQQTAASSYSNSWSLHPLLRALAAIAGWPPLWAPLLLAQHLFERSHRGYAALFLARKTG